MVLIFIRTIKKTFFFVFLYKTFVFTRKKVKNYKISDKRKTVWWERGGVQDRKTNNKLYLSNQQITI